MPLWSKRHGLDEPYPLISHLLDTAASATVLWDLWLRSGLRNLIEESLGPSARAWVAATAGLHDIGKASPVFAGQLLSPVEPWHEDLRRELGDAGYHLNVPGERLEQLRRHEAVSAMSLGGGLRNGDWIAENWIAAAALGHHGTFKVPDDRAGRAFRKSAGGAWAEARDGLRSAVLSAVGLDPDLDAPVVSPAAAVLISGLVVLADRTASEWHAVRRAQGEIQTGVLDPDDHGSWMQHRKQFFVRRLHRTLGMYRDFDDAQAAITGDFDLRPLQEAALKTGDGLWVAMAPTGNGKTEAALLRHSLRPERLIFALPTQATTNAMMKRVQKVYQGSGNVAELAHRLASVEDFYALRTEFKTLDCHDDPGNSHDHGGQGLIPSEFLRSGTARLLAPVSVSTIDQVLAGSLRTKWAHLRLLTIANAHVVIDEAHLMDHYQSALTEQLMSWWGTTGTRVTILSATLPTWQRDAFAAAYARDWTPAEITFPSHESVPGTPEPLDQNSYGIAVTTTEGDDTVKAHLDWAAAIHGSAPCARIGIVVNTVGRAQEVARRLALAGKDPIVLHSRMTAGHRRDAADRLLREIGKGGAGTGSVLVGTQAVEASLDIDLDAMSTDLAPSPSLIQRAGRVWRHTDPRRATRLSGAAELPLHVVRGNGKRGALPYFQSELDRVWKYLKPRTRLVMPDDSQAFVEASALRPDEVDWTEQDELVEHARRYAKALGVVIDVAELVDTDADLATLERLTGFEVDEETATRLIEPPSITAIIVDPHGQHGVPGAWQGPVAGLEALDPKDRDGLRRAMEATVPLNGALARLAISEMGTWAPASGVLNAMVPIVLGNSALGYDPELGVIRVEEG